MKTDDIRDTGDIRTRETMRETCQVRKGWVDARRGRGGKNQSTVTNIFTIGGSIGNTHEEEDSDEGSVTMNRIRLEGRVKKESPDRSSKTEGV